MRRSPHGRGRPAPRRKPREGDISSVAVVEVTGRDADGELLVRPTRAETSAPVYRLAPGSVAGPAPGPGDRLLVRFETGPDLERPIARLIKPLGQSAHRVLGVVRRIRGAPQIEPVDRRSREHLRLSAGDADGVEDGELVLVQLVSGEFRQGAKLARVLERLGREDDPRAASLLACHLHGLPLGFPAEALAEASTAKPATLKGRQDLRNLPLVTIDPSDARDHDDAVFAEADSDIRNPGGWIIWVAIADVAHFVTPGSALDATARAKGNSVYFPDRVEPMLPEALSADLCSLMPGETRACLAVRMVFDAAGEKISHGFVRGLMRSAASLTYEQAQAAFEGTPDAETAPLMETVLSPLWRSYQALRSARERRSPLEITSAERRIMLDAQGRVTSISHRTTLEAHRLIEEMMIQANVCAAETLEQKRANLIFRVHDAPSADKLDALADFLESLALPWTKGEPPRTRRFNRLLEETRDGPHSEIVNEVVLRTQSQAIYATDNLGHFGLNLTRYTHFTSPIRRYADLTVHRALIGSLGLGEDGQTDAERRGLADIARHITSTERRAMAAERDATDRYIAGYLADRIGARFEGRITGVTRFGLFVRLDETGADGLVPVSRLGGGYLHHDETAHALVDADTGVLWRLGRRVEVELAEATPVTGGLLLRMLSDPEPAAEGSRPRGRQAVRRRPGPMRKGRGPRSRFG